MLIIWLLILLISVWIVHWGADKLGEPLEKLRRQWGLSEVAGAAVVALATASPEIATNTASAVQGVSDIGLGNLLGSNIISVPVIVTVAYLSSQTSKANRNLSTLTNNKKTQKENYPQLDVVESWTSLKVKPEALKLQALPYLAVIALIALLTIPPAWGGLQPIDGWIMLIVYLVYVSQAILRNRESKQSVNWSKKEIWIAGSGVIVLGIGAYLVVLVTEKIISILGISQVIGGLFITSTLSIFPEVFATWSVARSGQMTAATTSVIADNTVTMTLAVLPLALVGIPIIDSLLFSVNLAFVALIALVYAVLMRWGKPKYSFELWEVCLLISIYLLYLIIMVVWVL